ncbi:MAG: glycosyltransferase family 2 protein [Gemmataceae bacterium]
MSILLVLHNRAELTLACLRSLEPCLRETAAEVILVDNASRDDTSALLERIHGATVIRNAANDGFPPGMNQAAAAATGEFLLLLNNDAEVLGDSVRTALRFLTENRDVGAAGGRLVLLDGTLQEAGCTLWREGHVFQYGRGHSPLAVEYLFQREVDYCSAVFLMTRRELFHKMGGLDTAFAPGYFEDADYCIRLWRSGWRVVYLPEVLVRHYENASSPCRKELLQLYRRNHLYFTHKHADWLAWKCPSVPTPHLWARTSHDDRFKVLYLPTLPFLFPPNGWEKCSTIVDVVRRLRALNCFVTVYPIRQNASIARRDLPGLPPDSELLPGGSLDTLTDLLVQRRDYYDCILASDPRVLQHVRRSAARPVARASSF